MNAGRLHYAFLAAGAIAALLLVAVELGAGALGFGDRLDRDPCMARATIASGGADPAVQRIVLDGIDGAACVLNTTREELVLSFAERGGSSAAWTSEELEEAVRGGLLAAIERAETRGGIGRLEAKVLKEVVRRAPIAWLIEGRTRGGRHP